MMQCTAKELLPGVLWGAARLWTEGRRRRSVKVPNAGIFRMKESPFCTQP